MKRFRVALALVVLLLALGGLATWDEWQTKKDGAAKKLENKLSDIKAADVTEVRYNSLGGSVEAAPPEDGGDPGPATRGEPTHAVAVKQDGVWRLSEPSAGPADQGSIDILVTTLLDYTYASVVAEDKTKWPEFGVDQAQRTITLKTGGDKPTAVTVYVGNKAPIGYNVYVRTSRDDRVLLGSQHLLAATSKSLFEFRDKTLVKVDAKTVTNFTYVLRGESAIEIVKTDNKYAIVKPQPLDADGAEVRDYIDELGRIKASGYIDAPTAAQVEAFKSPLITLAWRNEQGAQTTLLLSEYDTKLYATFNPGERLVELGAEWRGKLTKTLNDFRNRRLFASGDLEAKTLAVDGESYEQVGGDWYKAEDAIKFGADDKFTGAAGDKPDDVGHIRAFVVDLEFAKTDEFLPLDGVIAANLPAAPLHRITLALKKGGEMILDVYPDGEKDDRYLVRRSGGSFLYRVSQSTFNSMAPESAVIKPEGGQMPGEGAPALEDEGLNFDEEEPAPEEAG